jgi:dTMP kinase
MHFITFEGPDGYGKTTQAALLYRRLSPLLPTVLMREPGGLVQSPFPLDVPRSLGDEIRATMIRRIEDPKIAAMLFIAAFADDTRSILRPLRTRDDVVVISDRWLDSTYAYQGGVAELRPMVQFADIEMPHCTVLLTGPPDVVLASRTLTEEDRTIGADRAHQVNNRMNRYYELIRYDPYRWVLVGAMGSVEDVHDRIWARLQSRLFGVTVEDADDGVSA